MLKYSNILISICLCFALSTAQALTLPLPKDGNDLVGRIQYTKVQEGDTLPTIARRFDVGYYELIEANPEINPKHLIPGTTMTIPTQYILPPVERKGLVINLAEMRMYYFPEGKDEVVTYPIAIGRDGWNTPVTRTHVGELRKDPVWYVPETIRQARAKDGVELPKKMEPGPDNPLGKYAMRLATSSYQIHGTNDTTVIGRRDTSGCIRMFPEDIKALFNVAFVGLPINIIDMPFKAGWQNNVLYLETHVPVHDKSNMPEFADNLTPMVKTIVTATHQHPKADIDWDNAIRSGRRKDGVPEAIGQYVG